MKTKIVRFIGIMTLLFFANVAAAQMVSPASITQGVVYLKDIQSSSTEGGTCTSGNWIVRTLNTTEGDTDLVSLSSNQFTLQPGVYSIDVTAPARGVDAHKIRLYDVTNSGVSIFGSSSFANSGSVEDSVALLNGALNITTATTYQIEHACATTKNTNGFGTYSNLGSFELYTQVKITRLR